MATQINNVDNQLEELFGNSELSTVPRNVEVQEFSIPNQRGQIHVQYRSPYVKTPHSQEFLETSKSQDLATASKSVKLEDVNAFSNHYLLHDERTRQFSDPNSHHDQDDEQIRSSIPVLKNVEHFAKRRINTYMNYRGYQEAVVSKAVDIGAVEDVDSRMSSSNCIIFGSNYKVEDLPEEMERFFRFYCYMKAINPQVSHELKPMLMPLLVSMFQDAISSNNNFVCYKLFGDFCKKILQEHKTEENLSIAVRLAVVKSSKSHCDQMLTKMSVKSRTFIISDWTFYQLRKFLNKLRKPILLNIFTNFFIIKIKSISDVSESLNINVENEEKLRPSLSCSKKVQFVLNELRNSVNATLPSISVYTTNGDPISGACSTEGSLVAFGLSCHGIRVCSSSKYNKLPSDSSWDTEDIPSPADVKCISGHDGAVYGVQFHPKTKLLYSAGEDKTLRAWDLNKQNGSTTVYMGHEGPVWCLDISPSGHLIATGSMDTTARIWVPERPDFVRIFVGHYFDVDCIKFHPNESYVATGSVDKSVRLWSVADGNLVRVMTGVDGKISALAVHDSGNYIIGGGDDQQIYVWDIREGEVLAKFPCNTCCKDLVMNRSMLAACFRDGSLQMWNLRSLIGGSSSLDLGEKENDNNFSCDSQISQPFTIRSKASSLIKLHYQDFDSLYCLGSDPTIIQERNASGLNTDETSLESSNIVSSSAITDEVSPDGGSNSPVCIRLNVLDPNELPEYLHKDTKDYPFSQVDNASSTLSELQECLNLELGNTDNTITSSDMEFDVDDQILASFVDDTQMLQSSTL